jgi:hypothetical protein
MVSGNDQDIRDLTRSIKDLVQAIKSLEQTNRELLTYQRSVSGIEQVTAFQKYMNKPVPGVQETLVLGICGNCATGNCKNARSRFESLCSCCKIDHKRYEEGKTND